MVERRPINVNTLLLLVAVILFVLAALGVGVAGISLGWLGLAFFAGSSLV